MSGHFVKHVGRRVPATGWTDEQLEVLVLRWRDMSDRDLAELLSEHGPQRTESAVADKRNIMGLKRPRGFQQSEVRAKARASWQSKGEAQEGWPAMRGSAADRERRYLTLLFEGLQEERRRALAEQEAA